MAASNLEEDGRYTQDIMGFLCGNTSGSVEVSPAIATPNSGNDFWEEIRMDQLPTRPDWALIALYKSEPNGSLRSWQIRFIHAQLEIVSGLEGDLQTEIVPVDGESLFTARFKYREMYRQGYRPAGSSNRPNIRGMKAGTYTSKAIRSWPIYMQPKIKGIRALCQEGGMRSWTNQPIAYLDHIQAEIKEFFEYLPLHATLDGVLYNHELSTFAITSIFKASMEGGMDARALQYWIFDVAYEDEDGTPFERRCELLINAFHRFVEDRSSSGVQTLPITFRIVPTQIARSPTDLLAFHDQQILAGFEGVMVKRISNQADPNSKIYLQSLYQSYVATKSTHILKLKRYHDQPGKIISVSIESSGLSVVVEDKSGQSYSIGLIPSLLRTVGTLSPVECLIGKEITIRWPFNPQTVDSSEIATPPIPIGVAITLE